MIKYLMTNRISTLRSVNQKLRERRSPKLSHDDTANISVNIVINEMKIEAAQRFLAK